MKLAPFSRPARHARVGLQNELDPVSRGSIPAAILPRSRRGAISLSCPFESRGACSALHFLEDPIRFSCAKMLGPRRDQTLDQQLAVYHAYSVQEYQTKVGLFDGLWTAFNPGS